MPRHHHSVSVLPIAKPLAGHRLTKKIGALITKSAEAKTLIYGVKDTGKAHNKKESGLTVIGGNVSPMDVISHLPGECERLRIPYVFLPQKEQISAYAKRTAPVACVHIRTPTDEETLNEFNSVLQEIQQIDAPQPETPAEP